MQEHSLHGHTLSRERNGWRICNSVKEWGSLWKVAPICFITQKSIYIVDVFTDFFYIMMIKMISAKVVVWMTVWNVPSSTRSAESNKPPSSVDSEAIFQGYKLAFPENAQALDEWMLGEDEYNNYSKVKISTFCENDCKLQITVYSKRKESAYTTSCKQILHIIL